MQNKTHMFIAAMAVAAGRPGSTLTGRDDRTHPSPNKLQVIGHRGAAGLAPENSLAAFRKALELKIDAVEMDVQVSSDGELVIYHNYWLNPDITRTPDGSWLNGKVVIKDTPLAELQTYDVGRLKPTSLYALRYPGQQPADGERIPTLRETLSLLKKSRQYKPQLFIEIKTSPLPSDHSSPPEAVADALIDRLTKEKITNRVKILSFDWRALYHVQKIAPDIPTVYVSRIGGSVNNIQPGGPGPSPYTAPIDVEDFGGSIPAAIRAAGGSGWAPHHREFADASLQEAHRLGLKVYVWSPDGAGRMRRLIARGVDGIITNRPDILQSVLKGQ